MKKQKVMLRVSKGKSVTPKSTGHPSSRPNRHLAVGVKRAEVLYKICINEGF